MRQLRRYSFSIVLALFIVGVSALYFYASRSSVEQAETISAEQRKGEIPDNSRSQRATLSVYSEPANAAVIMKGDTVGRTPLIEHRLQTGVYGVTVAKKNYWYRDTVVVLRGNQAAVYRPQLRRRYRGEESGTQTEAQETNGERSPRPPPGEQQRPIQEGTTTAEAVPESSPAQETSADSSGKNEVNGSVDAPTAGTLRLRAEPESTAVEVNKEAVGRSPLRLDSVPPGIHEVAFARPGYKTLTKQVEVRAGGEVSLEVSLAARPGLLRVLVEPWGSIFINQQRRARSTDVWYQTDVPAGTHEISVHHPSLGKKTRTVEVTPGDTLSVVFDMWEK